MTTQQQASSGLKERLTGQLVEILKKFEGIPFGKCHSQIKKACEDFMVSIGIQRVLLPKIDIWIDDEGFVNVKMSDYPRPSTHN